ncbi:MAG: threonylcarbamoyl-AMP synthase [Bacteroidetes bacterium]|nr:MAG: threonylcarbamoyl-AMP synthase [Bacteroidota bacterium]
MYVKINPENPQDRLLHKVVDCLREGGVIIYPTDTVYGLGCDIYHKKAVERLCRIKGLDPRKAYLTFVCDSLKSASQYTSHISTPLYKLMKRCLPGPYTFILPAGKQVPRHFQSRKKTVGIRVIDHPIVKELINWLGNPIASISLPPNEEQQEYNTDAELIYETYKKQVDMVVDGGPGGLQPSTVIDCSNGIEALQLIRQGAGSLEALHAYL